MAAKQFSMAKRLARQNNALLDTHVNAWAVEIVWARMVRTAQNRLRRLPADFMAAHPAEGPGTRAALAELVEDALAELLPVHPDLEGLDVPALTSLLTDIPPERPASARRPRSVAEARAQTLALASRYIDLKERVVRYDDPGGTHPQPRTPRARRT
jgi:hypothetical protein